MGFGAAERAREYRVLARARADEESVPEEKGGSSCEGLALCDEYYVTS